MKLSPGLNFINVLHTSFTLVGPKSVRIQSSSQYLFTLLGPTGAKAAWRTLMKLTPGVNYINILLAAFRYERALCCFSLVTVLQGDHKMLMNFSADKLN